MVVRVVQPTIRAYIYGREGSHGHEKEVVFASGARLTRIQQTRLDDVKAFGMSSGGRLPQKMVPTYCSKWRFPEQDVLAGLAPIMPSAASLLAEERSAMQMKRKYVSR